MGVVKQNESARIRRGGARTLWIGALLCGVIATLPARAGMHEGDRLAWTGAITQVEGSAGGGLAPWALIAGLGTSDQIGGSAHLGYVSTSDFELRSAGLAAGLHDRVEVSFTRQRFDASSVIPGLTLGQDVLGLKLRLAGEAIFAPDHWWPQLAIGAQAKRTLDFGVIPKAVGANHGQDVELYLAATKLYFAALAGRNAIVNLTLRRTRANQFGLLGFGGDQRDSFSLAPELSAALWVRENWLVGGEYRYKPSDLGAFREDQALDAFVAWNPLKPVTVTLAYVDLGRIAGKPDQRGYYLSLWLGI